MKLTAQIAGGYFGCEVMVTNKGVGKLNRIAKQGICVNMGEWHDGEWYDIDQCQLLLSPLSEISEEDLAEVAKMHSASWCKLDGNFLQIIKDDNMVECYYILNGKLPTFMTDYLRSKGYDCGYGSIQSLIEAGIAVTK